MSRQSVVVGVLAAGLLAFAQGAAAQMQRVAIIDPSGFEKPIPAHWVQLPAGWRTQGGVIWDQNAPCGATPSFRWQASSPDGSQLLTIHPSEAWTWDNLGIPATSGQCPRVPITNVRQYLESFVQRNRPGARILDYRDRPDLIRGPPPPSGNGMQWRKDGGELLIAYAGPGGERRESVSAVVLFSLSTMSGVMPGEVRQFLSGIASAPTTLSAPAGALDMNLLTHVATTGQTDPAWQARMNKHNAVIAGQNQRGAAERGQIIADTNREISDMQMRGWEESQATNARIHARNVDVATGTERYADPDAGQVRLDSNYDNNWRASDGTYLQSNDPNFDPNRDLDTEAERLERIE
jgi:hypothetical protein